MSVMRTTGPDAVASAAGTTAAKPARTIAMSSGTRMLLLWVGVLPVNTSRSPDSSHASNAPPGQRVDSAKGEVESRRRPAGAYLLARDLGAQPIRGAIELSPTSNPAAASYHAGDIVVLTVPDDGTHAAELVRAVIDVLARGHLRADALPAPATISPTH